MKKLFYQIFLIFALIVICNTHASAKVIEGGVAYTVDSARSYVQEGQINNIEISGPLRFQAENAEKVVYSYNNSGEVIGITVQYINDEKNAYIYNKNGNLIYTEKYDRSIKLYPHRGYRYNLDGELVLTSLTVSKNEMFRFSPGGKLLAHSIDGIIYDENDNVIGHGK